MSYVIGPQGPTGIAGTQGLQGKAGPYGPAFGPTGQSWTVAPSMNVVTPTSTTLTLNPITTFYNLYGIGSLTVNVPNDSAWYPLPEQSGIFWSFRNNTGVGISITFTGGYNSTISMYSGETYWLVMFTDANLNSSYVLY